METELERLIVLLTGDGSSYMDMLKQAQSSTQDTTDKIKKAGEDIEKFGDRLKGFASTVIATLSTIGLSIGVFSAFNKFSGYEEGVIRLNAAIEANGGNVQAATAQYAKFAGELERTTMLSRGQVMGMIRQAETMGMSGQAAERATRFAGGFAAALSQSPEHAMTLAIAMERGNVHMLRRIPALRGITNEQELLKKAQDLAIQGMRISNELSLTAAGRLEKLKQGIGKITKDIGGLIAEALLPLLEVAKKVVDWFNSLDSGVRKVIAAVLLGIAAIPALAAAWAYLSTVISTVSTVVGLLKTSLMGLLLNPYALALAAAILIIYTSLKRVADAMGGWDKLWVAVQTKAMEFWKWFEPTWNKLKQVGLAAWAVIKAAALLAWGVIKDAVSVVVYGVQQLWKWLQQVAAALGISRIGVDLDNVIELLNKLEFGLKNFQKVATYVWLVVQYQALKFYLDLQHFFNVQLPEVTAWFLENWYAIWTDAVNFSTTVIGNLASNIVSVITNIPGLISGAVRWDQVWRPLTEGFRSALGGLPELTQREMTELEGVLMAEYEAIGADINESYADFRARRLEEMRREDLAAQASDDRDQTLTRNKKDRHTKLDAVLSGSAEALARAAAFREQASESRDVARGGAGGRGAPAGPAAPAQDLGAALQGMFGGGGAIWDRIRGSAVNAWNTITAWAKDKWDEIRDYALSRWDAIREWAVEFWRNLPANVMLAMAGLQALILTTFDNVAAGILGIWDSIDWDKVLDAGEKFFFETLPDAAVVAFGAIVVVLSEILQTMANPARITQLFAQMQTAIGPAANTFFSDLGTRLETFNREVWARIETLAANAFNRVIARITGGAIGGEGGPAQQVQRALGINRGGGGGEAGGNEGVPILRELRQLNGTVGGMANQAGQAWQNLGLPNLGG